MKRDSSVGLQATQLTGCVCAEGKQVQRLSHAEHACTLKMTSSLIIESVLRPPLTIVRSDKRLLTEIPHFNSNRKKETRLRCNQMSKNDNTGKTVLPWSQEPWLLINISITKPHRQSMLPVTAPLDPITGLTVVTMLSWSCLVKRFTNRCSFSANSHSSKAPAG